MCPIPFGRTIALWLALSSTAPAAPNDGLVAHWRFDEGTGDVLHDSSDHKNDGRIQGARWVKVAGGFALEFDGSTSIVDCGNSPSLDARKEVSITAWLCPAAEQVAKEPGILGKQFSSFLATYYGGKLYWYVNSGGNNARANLEPGVWTHVAVTFSEDRLRIYINGSLARKEVCKISAINPGGSFYIGGVVGDPQAGDQFYRVSAGFKGLIDEVKVFNRTLSASEVKSEFDPAQIAARNAIFASQCRPVEAAETIKQGTLSMAVGKNGAIQINNGQSFCVIESAFSYPGDKIGANALGPPGASGEAAWQPRVRKLDEAMLEISAAGAHYALKRTLRLTNGRIEWEDALTNRRGSPVGILITHKVVAPETMGNARWGHTAASPLVFFSQLGGDFGIIAEDDLGRLQFDSSCIANTATIRYWHFGLDTGKSHTFKTAIYPLKPTGDDFEFVNRVRADWKANFPVIGPWAFFNVGPKSLVHDRDALRKHLTRRPLAMAALSPWLDYDPGVMDRTMTREEYKAMVTDAAKVLREVAPEMKLIGCIETDWVTIYPQKMKNGDLIYQRTGTPEQMARVIDESDLPWKDSVKRDKDGHMVFEFYERGGKPQFSLGVYPAPGNYHEKFLLEQAAFLMDDCGLDGFYIDEFSQNWVGGLCRVYAGWDGHTVDIDPATGEIAAKCIDCGLVGAKSRVALIESGLRRGKTLTANWYCTSLADGVLPHLRFWEQWAFINVAALEPGKEPPFAYEAGEGQFHTPIGLGFNAKPDEPDVSKSFYLGVMAMLRHGLLYYHYAHPDLPETGPYAGEYTPLCHMFPLTPLELHKGWIKGQERIVACVCLETDWRKPSEPQVLVFDLHGRPIPSEGKAEITGGDGQWRVRLNLADWSEIAVIE